MYVCGYVQVFLLDGLQIGRQTFMDYSTTPQMKHALFFFKIPHISRVLSGFYGKSDVR